MAVSRLGGCPLARQLCVLLLCASHFFLSLFQEELEPDVDGSPRGGADVPQRPKVCSHGRLGTITQRAVEAQLCWCAVTRLADANVPACFLFTLPQTEARAGRFDTWGLGAGHLSPTAAASRFQTKMLLAQTFTKVLTSTFCCGIFALFKTESSSNTVNPLQSAHAAFWEFLPGLSLGAFQAG